jgi:hypothetical protein
MARSSGEVRSFYGITCIVAAIALALLFLAAGAMAQSAPSLTAINPATRSDLTKDSVDVKLTGTGFTDGMSLVFDPPNVIDADKVAETLKQSGGTNATVTFKLSNATNVPNTVSVSVQTANGHSGTIAFNTGVVNSTCLEALKTGQCVLRWELETTTATGNSSQSSKNTAPNIIVKLDYEWHPHKSQPQKQAVKQQSTALLHIQQLKQQTQQSTARLQEFQEKATDQGLKAQVDVLSAKVLAEQPFAQQATANPFLQSLLLKTKAQLKEDPLDVSALTKIANSMNDSWTDHLEGHLEFKTGYTQAVTATKVQPASGSTGATTSCPGGTSTSSTSCTSAIPQQAYVAELSTRIGWNTGVQDQGVFGEFGLGARGSFQYLIPTNKITQSGGLNYIDLSSANPQNAVGFYEATGHFRLAQVGHNKTRGNGDPNTGNSSDLLVIEGGYQNNRGLQQLMASDPLLNTRNRYVARFYVRPEISSTNHTQLSMGMEYSGGINGGPHVVQLFFGTNINPAKLFGGNKSSSKNSN